MIVSVSKQDWCDVRSCLEITDYNLVLLRHLTSEFPNWKRVVCFIPVKDGRCRLLCNVDFDRPHTHDRYKMKHVTAAPLPYHFRSASHHNN